MRLGPAHRVPRAVLAPLRPFLYKQVQKAAVSMTWCQRLHKAEGWPCGVQKLLRQQDINLADDPPQAATSAKLRADLRFILRENLSCHARGAADRKSTRLNSSHR